MIHIRQSMLPSWRHRSSIDHVHIFISVLEFSEIGKFKIHIYLFSFSFIHVMFSILSYFFSFGPQYIDTIFECLTKLNIFYRHDNWIDRAWTCRSRQHITLIKWLVDESAFANTLEVLDCLSIPRWFNQAQQFYLLQSQRCSL